MTSCGLRSRFIEHYMKFVRLETPVSPVSKTLKQYFAPSDFLFQQSKRLPFMKMCRYHLTFPNLPTFVFHILRRNFSCVSADLTWRNLLMGSRMIVCNSFLMAGKEASSIFLIKTNPLWPLLPLALGKHLLYLLLHEFPNSRRTM